MLRWIRLVVLDLSLVQDLLRIVNILCRYFYWTFLRRWVCSSFRATGRINFTVELRWVKNPFDYFRSLSRRKSFVVRRFNDHWTILSREVAAHFVLWCHISITILLGNKVIRFSLCLIHSAIIGRMSTWLDLLVVHQTVVPLSLSWTAGHCWWRYAMHISRWLSLIQVMRLVKSIRRITRLRLDWVWLPCLCLTLTHLRLLPLYCWWILVRGLLCTLSALTHTHSILYNLLVWSGYWRDLFLYLRDFC